MPQPQRRKPQRAQRKSADRRKSQTRPGILHAEPPARMAEPGGHADGSIQGQKPKSTTEIRKWVTAEVEAVEGFVDQILIDMICRRTLEPIIDRPALEKHLEILMDERSSRFSAALWRFFDGNDIHNTSLGKTPQQSDVEAHLPSPNMCIRSDTGIDEVAEMVSERTRGEKGLREPNSCKQSAITVPPQQTVGSALIVSLSKEGLPPPAAQATCPVDAAYFPARNPVYSQVRTSTWGLTLCSSAVCATCTVDDAQVNSHM